MSTKDQILSSELHGEALLTARRPELQPLIDHLRKVAQGRDDIRTECAGILAGSWFSSTAGRGEAVTLVKLAVTSGAALVGHDIGGLVGAEVAQVVPLLVDGLIQRRRGSVARVLQDGVDLAGISGPELVAWVDADDQHAEFFMAALEAAYSTLDRHKLRLLARVLADGFRNDAPQLDIDREVMHAIRDLETAHLRVLQEAAQAIEEQGDNPIVLSMQLLRDRIPGWSEVMDALVAGLRRTGCVAGGVGDFFGTPPLAVTPFGHRCLEIIRREADSLPED